MTDTIPIRYGTIPQPTTLNLSRIVTQHGLLAHKNTPLPRFEQVITAVCQTFELDRQKLLSRARPEHLAWPRQIGMALAYQIAGRSLADVGAYFGGRGHDTVLHAIERVKNRCLSDKVCRKQFEQVKGRLQ